MLGGANTEAQLTGFSTEHFLDLARRHGDQGADAQVIAEWFGTFFNRADFDGDGRLDMKELEYFFRMVVDAVATTVTKSMGIDLSSRIGRSLATPEEAAEEFAAFDLDGDGKWSRQEAMNVLRTVTAFKNEEMTSLVDEALDTAFRHADVDGDGSLSKGEADFFVYLALALDKPVLGSMEAQLNVDEAFATFFNELDEDGSGKVSWEEIADMFYEES